MGKSLDSHFTHHRLSAHLQAAGIWLIKNLPIFAFAMNAIFQRIWSCLKFTSSVCSVCALRCNDCLSLSSLRKNFLTSAPSPLAPSPDALSLSRLFFSFILARRFYLERLIGAGGGVGLAGNIMRIVSASSHLTSVLLCRSTAKVCTEHTESRVIFLLLVRG